MYVIQIMRSVFYTRLGSYLSMTSVTSVTKGQTKAIVSVCPNRSIRRANIDLDGFGGIHLKKTKISLNFILLGSIYDQTNSLTNKRRISLL